MVLNSWLKLFKRISYKRKSFRCLIVPVSVLREIGGRIKVKRVWRRFLTSEGKTKVTTVFECIKLIIMYKLTT